MKRKITRIRRSVFGIGPLLVALLLMFGTQSAMAQLPPIIASVTPTVGIPGTGSVTITGLNFNDTASRNVVVFGSVQATVTAATLTTLTVTVPLGAVYSNVSVMNKATRLSGYASDFFLPTFNPAPYIAFSHGFRPKADVIIGNHINSDAAAYQVALGDIDGDGKPDMVLAMRDIFLSSRSPVQIYLNTSVGGVLSYAAPVVCTASAGVQNIKLADLDGDGKLDIIASAKGSGRISCIHNLSTPGNIVMAPNANFALSTGAGELAIADFDGDGKLDIAAAEYETLNTTNPIDSVMVFKNIITAIPGAAFTSTGTFKLYYVAFAVGDGPVSIAAADFDADGKSDIVVSNQNSNNISILKNISLVDTFMFMPAVNIPVGTVPQELVVGNINNDGKPDIIINSFATNSMMVLQNQALPGLITATSFGTPVSYQLNNGTTGLGLGDLDGDGKVDIAVSMYFADSFTIFRNTTAGTVGETITNASFTKDGTYSIGAGSSPIGITIGDIDGDTKPDIITANNTSNSFSIFESFEIPDTTSIITGADSVCVNSTITLTSSHGVGATGYWTVTNAHGTIVGGVGAADTMATFTGLTTGFDTVLYHVVYLSDTNVTSKVIRILPLADTGAINGPSQVCLASTIALSNITGGRGTWSSTNNAVASVDSAGNVTGNGIGNAIIRYTVTSSCGTLFASHSVTVLDTPNAGTITGPGGTCVGSSITLTASVPGGVWFNEHPAIATHAPAGTQDVVTGASVGADTILYIVSTASCGSDTAFHSVGVINGVTGLPIMGDTNVCAGNTTQLYNAAPGGAFTSDAPLTASVNPLTGLVTGNLPGTANITYTVTYVPCGTVTTTRTVVVGAQPTITPIANQTACNGSIVAVGLVSDRAGSTFAWTNTDTTIGLPASGTTNPIVFTAIDTAATNKVSTITVTATANGCVSNPVSFTVTVKPTATLTSTTTPPSICDGNTFSYIQTSNRAGTTYTWHRSVVTGITNPAANGSGSIAEVLHNNTSDSVQVVYNDTLHYNGCLTNANITVFVKASPTLSTTTNAPICDSTLFAYAPMSTTGGASYAWHRPAVAGISNPASIGTGGVTETLDNITANPVNVTYIYTTTASGCTNVQNVDVVVEPTPLLSGPLDQGVRCDSELFSYVPTSATTGATFTWTRNAVAGIANPSASGTDSVHEYLFNTTNTPIFVAYQYVSNINGCTDTQSVSVTINPRAYLTSSLTPPGICSEDFFNYNPTSNITAASVTFSWTRAGLAGISNLPGSGVGNPNEMLINTTNSFIDVAYMFTTAYLGCSYTQQVSVRVQPKPILIGDAHDTVCSGSPFVYHATSPVGGTAFAWTRPIVIGITPDTASGVGDISATLNNSTFTRLDAIYVYTLTANGCSYVQNYTVTVNPLASPLPTITTHAPNALCLNTMFQNFGASNAPADTGIVYTWSAMNAAVFATGATGQYAIVNFTTPGNAVVILSAEVAGTGCASTDTFAVAVSSSLAPTVDVRYFNHQFVCTPADMDSYQWGYDNAQLDSTILTGEINQDYNNPTPDMNLHYWVMTTKGDCFQKSYYQIPTGVANVNADNIAMKLFPNPASEVLTVEVSNILSGDVEVQILNMVGQQVGTTQLINNKAVFSVGSFAPGSYLVVGYRNGVKVATSRFIKN